MMSQVTSQIMKNKGKILAGSKPIAFWLIVSLAFIANSRTVVFGEFIEDFGHIGSVRKFKGQVRDGLDVPIPKASLQLTNLSNGEIRSVDADEKGQFSEDEVSSGKYRVRVTGNGFNIAEYTVKISRGNPFASTKYIVIRLSPGCATGNSGIALVRKANQPSFSQ